MSFLHLCFLGGLATAFSAALPVSNNTSLCKANILDSTWPEPSEWSALNETLGGALISTSPVASSCWNNTNFDSSYSCQAVQSNWSSSIFHASLPESIGVPLFANNSCLPSGVDGFSESQGCRLGGLPSYVVNATTESQVAQAVKWAAERDIRVVIKGTGHDLSGRSSGAFALSIWTYHFRHLERNTNWTVPGASNSTGASNATEDVIIAGSGHGWGNVLNFALDQGRIVTTGQDPSVGLGGYIQGGGHGPLASSVGLAAQQVLQVRIVTTRGEILVANAAENTDLFWAIRGGGAGQYGVVTQYVIRHYPAPESVTMGTLSITPLNQSAAAASWDATAILFKALPDLMDAGVAGALSIASGETSALFNPSAVASTGSVVLAPLWAFNRGELRGLVDPIIQEMQKSVGNASVSIEFSESRFDNYSSFYAGISGSNTAGGGGVSSSRLLGRRHVDIPHDELRSYLQRSLVAEDVVGGTYMTVGLSGGPGVHNHPDSEFGAIHPSWKSAYLHLFVGGASASPNATTTPKMALADNAAWIEENKETLWREWAPDSGSYMNEANPYNTQFKDDFYGLHYERLSEIKQKHDPTESLFVLSGVGSDKWDYDLQSGKLCRTA